MKATIGDLWVDPINAHWFIFTGENLDEINYGWVPYQLPPERENKGLYPEQAAKHDGEPDSVADLRRSK